ncbi:MAG: hypothetical protein ACM3ML_15660 [Micromonosporaceae bacterium]
MHSSELIDNTRPAAPGWRTVNTTPAERIGRVVIGVAGPVTNLPVGVPA